MSAGTGGKGPGSKPRGLPRGLAVSVRTARSRSAASQRWLARQLNDPYVAAAKAQGLGGLDHSALLITLERLSGLAPPDEGSR